MIIDIGMFGVLGLLNVCAPGVLNFHFGILVCGLKGLKWGLKEWSGTKNRVLKSWFFGKNKGLKNWILDHFQALEQKVCKIWGFGIEIFVNLGSRTANFVKIYDFFWKGVLKNWIMLKRGS